MLWIYALLYRLFAVALMRIMHYSFLSYVKTLVCVLVMKRQYFYCPKCATMIVPSDVNFYRAMHFSAYARSWDRMSSVCPSVCL